MTSTYAQVDVACQLCGQHPLQSFVVPKVANYAFCQRCCLYQYGPAQGPDFYDQDAYYVQYDEEKLRKRRSATVRLNRLANTVKAERPRILDVGCGLGTVLEAAEARGWHAEGVDFSAYAADACRKKGLLTKAVEGVQLPFDDESFDIITALNVIEHVEDVRVSLTEWSRVLRPNGVILVDTCDAACLKVRLLKSKYRRFWRWDHRYAFTPDNLKEFFLRAGLEPFRPPFLGQLSELPGSLVPYAVAYRTQYALRGTLRVQKAFELFARKSAQRRHQSRMVA